MEERELGDARTEMRHDDADPHERVACECADRRPARLQPAPALLDLVRDGVLAAALGVPGRRVEVAVDRLQLDAVLDVQRVDPLGPVDLADAAELVRLETAVGDRHAASAVVSSARSRRTRSSIDGCVTNIFASPSSRNGLNGQSGSVAGDASNETSSAAWSSRMSASASPCGDSHSSAARRSASNSRFGETAGVRARCRDRAEDEQERSVGDQPPTRLASISEAASDDDRGLDRDVAVLHVRDLVREHAFELGRRARADAAGADGERRVGGPRPVASASGIPSGMR